MNEVSGDRILRFVGFDSAGEAFSDRERVFRGIYPGMGSSISAVLDICHNNKLFDYGIVATQLAPKNLFPELDYEFLLEHEKIPFISYPHEWPAAMLQQAALFHIDLYEKLAQHSLVIKDWHPQNILFKGTESVFVDFTSIVPFEKLYAEPYLTPPHIHKMLKTLWDVTAAYLWEMHQRMYVPYFLLPLYLMHRRQHQKARQRIFETTLNASRSVINPREVFSVFSPRHFVFQFNKLKKQIALIERGGEKQRFWNTTRREVENLKVVIESSHYSRYYEEKGENFDYEFSSQWTEKQKVVHESIAKYKPATVLDVASNTGWFSILAAKHGSQVVAFDIDEACVNRIYLDAVNQRLPILPLVIDFTKLTGDVFPVEYPDEESHTRIGGDFPLLIAGERRLKCEMAFALGILHHLILGNNHKITRIIESLKKLCTKYLLLEFISKNDRLITSELDFFPALFKDSNGFDWYTLDFVAELMKKHFRDVIVKDSHPHTRKILIGIK
jgi:SAM-dependent methyltransferase